jgi:hypothetical protein
VLGIRDIPFSLASPPLAHLSLILHSHGLLLCIHRPPNLLPLSSNSLPNTHSAKIQKTVTYLVMFHHLHDEVRILTLECAAGQLRGDSGSFLEFQSYKEVTGGTICMPRCDILFEQAGVSRR